PPPLSPPPPRRSSDLSISGLIPRARRAAPAASVSRSASRRVADGTPNPAATATSLRVVPFRLIVATSVVVISLSAPGLAGVSVRSEEHTSELQSRENL